MKARRFLFFGVALAGGLGILVLIAGARRPSHPVATLKVVDPSGNPIAGAVITPDGLRPKRGGGHYFWLDDRDPKPTPVVTDPGGVAAVAYPFYTHERLETEEISFRVDHPDYCPDRPFRTVNAAPPANAPMTEKVFHATKVMIRNVQARPQPVVLKPGAIVEVSGYLKDTNDFVTPLYVQVADVWDAQTNLWRQLAPGRLTSRRIPEGNRVLRLAHLPPGGPHLFSEPVSFIARPGVTNQFHLHLQPGCKLNGRLDDSVPRPVTGGWAVIEVAPLDGQRPPDTVTWHAWSPIETNGTFSIGGLPPGIAEIVAICDGYVSQDGKTGRRRLVRYPQQFTLAEGEMTVDLAMEPTATFELTATDDRGQPIEGAQVNLWPNVIWGDWGTTIFCTDLYNTVEGLTNTSPGSASLGDRRPTLYSATTGPTGVAVVTNLPAHADAFSVTHTNFELAVRSDSSGRATRDRSVRLNPGETVRRSVTLRKRGLDHVEHNR